MDFNQLKELKDNKNIIIAQKKATIKHADCVVYGSISNSVVTKSGAIKSISQDDFNLAEVIKAKIIINTTNILDSHGDVHINGIWKKTVNETKLIYHLQEHEMTFKHVISDDVIANIEKYKWTEIGQNYLGITEALVFESIIKKERNPFMFEQYIKGYVKQHSVGMQYINLVLCINSTDKYFKEEKQNWDKYCPMVVNSQDAIDAQTFWAVTEAKLIEGSAVVLGSNRATPTQSISNIEPSEDDTQPTDSRYNDTGLKSEIQNELREQLKSLFKN
jgi:hypothetical protein